MSLRIPLYLDLQFYLPSLDLSMVKQNAFAALEVVIAIDLLIATPAEKGSAVAARHLVASRALLDGHATCWTPLGCLLQQTKHDTVLLSIQLCRDQ